MRPVTTGAVSQLFRLVKPLLTQSAVALVCALRDVGALACATLVLGGCGVEWDDAHGRRHFVGFGHFSWSPGRVAPDTVVTGTDIIGIGVRATRDGGGISIGYSSDRTVRVADDTTVTMTCITCDLNAANPTIRQINERNQP